MQVYHHSCFAMGTRFNLVIPDCDEDYGNTLSLEIERILKKKEKQLSCFLDDSEVSEINREAINRPFVVTDEMAEIIELCNYYYTASGGAFDPALFFYKKQNKKNVISNIENYKGGWSDISWKADKKELIILNPDTGLDLGGFGKGYALNFINNFLVNKNIKSALISFGESSLCALGSHPLGKYWPIKIDHPASNAAVEINLIDASLSISGLIEKNKPVKHFSPHIFSPQAASFITDHNIVVVKADSPLDAEVLSTAVMAACPNQRQKIFNNFKEVEIYECIEGSFEFKKLL